MRDESTEPGKIFVQASGEEVYPPTVHVPVLVSQILQAIDAADTPIAGSCWIDGTAGGGGHSRLIADRIGTAGRLLAIDRDPAAVQRLQSGLPANCLVEQASYERIPELLQEKRWEPVDGILLDLGLSSDQLADRQRGFSFQFEGELDMRFDPTSGQPAWQWLRHVDEKTLADTIFQYGEERHSRRIARRIVEQRKSKPIATASELRDLIYSAIPGARRTTTGSRRHGRVDPATRTFQALRIAVNDELAILERALDRLPEFLKVGGLLLVISFHSLEDRIVKHAFRGDDRLQVLTKKPLQAEAGEIAGNPRARSAKLRMAKRVEPTAP